jgi:predicted TIM-barrel fold metal-dependent hydrolase
MEYPMVIDSHCHILPPGFEQRRAELVARDATFATLFSRPGAPMATAEALIDAMDRAQVSRAVVMGMGWCDRALTEEVNDYIVESAARYPDRLSGFCSVNPAWGDGAAAEMERCAAAGLRGVGELHPDTQEFDITDKLGLAPVMDTARRLGLPVLVHSSEPVGHLYPGKGRTTPGKLYRFIENFPETPVICAHWGGGLPFYAMMPEVPKVLRNVYFDMAASPFLYRPEVVATVAGLVGADKVLFATDYPLVQQGRLMRQVEESGLDSSDREAILGGNAARLLGL